MSRINEPNSIPDTTANKDESDERIARYGIKRTDAESAGMSAERLADAFHLVEQATVQGETPGAAALVVLVLAHLHLGLVELLLPGEGGLKPADQVADAGLGDVVAAVLQDARVARVHRDKPSAPRMPLEWTRILFWFLPAT